MAPLAAMTFDSITAYVCMVVWLQCCVCKSRLHVTGNLSVAEDSFRIRAKGSRPDEALDVTLKLPLLDPAHAGNGNGRAAARPAQDAGTGPFGIKLSDLLPLPGLESIPQRPPTEPPPEGGGHFSLRCGQLLMSAEVSHKFVRRTAQLGCTARS